MVAVAVLVLLVALVDPTEAAIPGKNGKIVFTSNRDGNGEIYVMNSDGTGLQGLTNNPASDLNPDFSPNGGQDRFHKLRDGDNSEIYTKELDGTGEQRLTSAAEADVQPDWQPLPLRISRGLGGGAPGPFSYPYAGLILSVLLPISWPTKVSPWLRSPGPQSALTLWISPSVVIGGPPAFLRLLAYCLLFWATVLAELTG